MPMAYSGKVISKYVDVWCAPSATHVPCINLSQSNVLDIRVFVIIIWNFRVIKQVADTLLERV
jgi:hypothetical protein